MPIERPRIALTHLLAGCKDRDSPSGRVRRMRPRERVGGLRVVTGTDIPMDAAEITTVWLSAALGVGVDDFSVTPLESGVVSDILRIHDVRYSRPAGELPASFVLKVPSRADE